jgi:hypothetical protein
VVLVEEVDVLDDEVLVVGPPALPAEAASPIPNPARARAPIIMVVLRSQFWACRTPAGFPGAKPDGPAIAPVAQSANDIVSDIAKQMAFFIKIPLTQIDET